MKLTARQMIEAEIEGRIAETLDGDWKNGALYGLRFALECLEGVVE